MKPIILYIVKLIPARILSLQARRPTGLIGRYVMTGIFNRGNADLNSHVREMLDLKKADQVLEIGFGPGKLIQDIAEIVTEGRVQGIDFSAAMMKQACMVNKRLISEGRVKLEVGECSSLPYQDNSFDKVCSSNTLYFWNDPDRYLREIFRVTKRGGSVVIGFRDGKEMSALTLSADVFRLYSPQDVADHLSAAGFSDVRVEKKESKPFASFCAVAYKK